MFKDCLKIENKIRKKLTRKQKMSVYSSIDLLVGFPAPWPDFVSTLIIRGWVWPWWSSLKIDQLLN